MLYYNSSCIYEGLLINRLQHLVCELFTLIQTMEVDGGGPNFFSLTWFYTLLLIYVRNYINLNLFVVQHSFLFFLK